MSVATSVQRKFLNPLRSGLCAATVGGLLMLAPQAALAQITIGGVPADSEERAVCLGGNSIAVPDDNDCETGLVGEDFFPVQGLGFGPSGTFISSNGDATFNNTTTVGGPATFNGTTTVNGAASFTGGVDMGGDRVTGVGDPTADTDAANKRYVDQQNATQNTRLDGVESKNTEQDTRLDGHDSAIGAIQAVNALQDAAITNIQTVNAVQDGRLTFLEGAIVDQQAQIDAINGDIGRLQNRDKELADGIAIALALDQPVFQNGQQFALRVGWGNFDGSDAVGVTGAGVLARGLVGGPSSTVVLDAGVGASTGQNMVAGRAGLTFGW